MGQIYLKVCLFGELYIEYEGKPIRLPLDIHSITAQLVIMLWEAGDSGINRDVILNRLYAENEVSNPANSMRVNIFRLRKMLKKLPIPDAEYILVENGIYRWDTSKIGLKTDVGMFMDYLQKAKSMPTEKGHLLLREAFELYRGDFLPALSTSQWVAVLTMDYQKKYVELVKRLYQDYMDKKKYDEALYISERAFRLYMYEIFAIMKIDAHIAHGDFAKALDVLDEFSKDLFHDFGVMPSEEVLRRYEQLSSRVSNVYAAVKKIQEHINEETVGGAYFCHFPSFIDCYRILKRLSARNGQSVHLVCCSITDHQGKCLERGDKRLENTFPLMKAIESSLRSGDIYTKSSDNMFLILLSGLTLEDCGRVLDRILDNFQKIGKIWGIRLDFRISPVSQGKSPNFYPKCNE